MKKASGLSGWIAMGAVLVLCAVAGADIATTGISGVVVNTTCAGPCAVPPPPPPLFTGDGLTVVIRSLPDHALVARLHPTDGHFGIETPPGLYKVRAFVGDPRMPTCWAGSRRRVLVEDGAVSHVRLKVANLCIL
ncbi:MAG TPA: hypothetical protein VGK20_09900 [Candidatus Binatia bacterium]|jgi:hypothetical protein